MHRRLPALLLLAGAVALLASATAVAAPADRASDRAKAQHDAIVDFWTPERRAAARPAIDRLRKVPMAKGGKPGKPDGGGGGGGGGDSTKVTGAPWTAADPVQRAVGKVFFTVDGGWYVCSASVVDSTSGNVVVTAGHCVEDGADGGFVANWIFYPSWEDGTDPGPDPAYGAWTATHLLTTSGWATSGDFNVDAAFAIVGNGSGGVLESVLGTAPAVSFDSTANGTDLHLFGYPHASPYDGDVLTYCAGAAEADRFGSTAMGVKCDMTGGSSGGPMYEEFGTDRAVASVNSFKYSGGKQRTHMFGPRFTATIGSVFSAATGASDCSAAGPGVACGVNSVTSAPPV